MSGTNEPAVGGFERAGLSGRGEVGWGGQAASGGGRRGFSVPGLL